MTKRITRSLYLLLLYLIALSPAYSDGIVQFVEADAFLGNEALYIDGVYAGDIGDTVSIDEGIHLVQYRTKFRHGISFRIKIDDDSGVDVGDFNIHVPFCVQAGEQIAVELSDGYVDSSWSGDGLSAVMVLPTVMFRERPIATQGCGSPSASSVVTTPGYLSIETVLKVATLRVTSDPTGADIYAKGENTDKETNATVKITYKQWEETISILLKRSGYANCVKTIKTKDRGNFDDKVHCDLRSV